MITPIPSLYPTQTFSSGHQPECTYLPVYVENSATKAEPAKKDKSLWHELGGNNPRISIEIDKDKKDKIVVSPSKYGISLYAPKEISETINNKTGDLALGVFPICENQKKELLLIKKIKGDFWYVPGGLVDKNDKTLWAAGIRELKEETGLQLNEQVEGKMEYAYESITPSRHNLMVFYSAKYTGCESPTNANDSNEISACAWFDPLTFWSSYLKEEIKSLPSIRLVFDHYLKNRFFDLGNDLISEYKKYKKHIMGSVDEILFDLCFLKLEGQHVGSLEVASLVEDVRKMAEQWK